MIMVTTTITITVRITITVTITRRTITITIMIRMMMMMMMMMMVMVMMIKKLPLNTHLVFNPFAPWKSCHSKFFGRKLIDCICFWSYIRQVLAFSRYFGEQCADSQKASQQLLARSSFHRYAINFKRKTVF